MRTAIARAARRLADCAAPKRRSTMDRVRGANLTYLGLPALVDLERCVREAPAGDLIECGVALGGSGIVLASLVAEGQQFHGYDVFGMIPSPGPEDPPEVHDRYQVIAAGESDGIGGDTYYGYRDNLYSEVAENFAAHGHPVDGLRVQLHRGLFQDMLGPERPVAVAHLDCDWYEAVALCLARIRPFVVPGGFVVCDDYYDWGGAMKAVDEFTEVNADFTPADFGTGHLILRRDSGG